MKQALYNNMGFLVRRRERIILHDHAETPFAGIHRNNGVNSHVVAQLTLSWAVKCKL